MRAAWCGCCAAIVLPETLDVFIAADDMATDAHLMMRDVLALVRNAYPAERGVLMIPCALADRGAELTGGGFLAVLTSNWVGGKKNGTINLEGWLPAAAEQASPFKNKCLRKQWTC